MSRQFIWVGNNPKYELELLGTFNINIDGTRYKLLVTSDYRRGHQLSVTDARSGMRVVGIPSIPEGKEPTSLRVVGRRAVKALIEQHGEAMVGAVLRSGRL